MIIRQAILDDVVSICQLWQTQIEKWQRIRADGYAEDVRPSDLTIYERWLHGGAWMSIETASIWLSHLVRGAGVPYVLIDDDGACVAYAEVCLSVDVRDKKHMHIAHIISALHDDAAFDALMAYLIDIAQTYAFVSIACSAYDNDAISLYQRYGFIEKQIAQQMSVPAMTGQAFYKATPAPDATYAMIAGWQMPIGESQNARFHWESLWHNLWAAVPEIANRRIHHLRLNASGQDAFICYQQHLYDPRGADVYCWTPKPFSSQLLVAIRDWAHREGYRTLTMFVNERVAKILSDNAEPRPQRQIIYHRPG